MALYKYKYRYLYWYWTEHKTQTLTSGLASPTTGLWSGNAPWFMCWLWCYINCMFVYLLNVLPHLLYSLLFLFLCFLSYLFTSWFVYFLTYRSTFSRICPFRFQAGCRRRQPNLPLFYLVLILCCIIFCYGCMFAFVVLVSVFHC